jgi:hypothetical protein
MKSRLKAPGSKLLKLEQGRLLSMGLDEELWMELKLSLAGGGWSE